MPTLLQLLLLSYVALVSTPAASQSVQQCLESNATRAVTACQQMLLAGNTDKTVFYKLASSYYELNKREDALEQLQKALKIHRSDARLQLLQRTIETEIREEKQFEASNETNVKSVEKGRIKISCLTRDSAQGMDACRQYLKISSVDSDRIEPRLAFLESKYGSDQNQTVSPKTKSASTKTAVQATTPATAGQTDKNNLSRDQIRELQTLLSKMGYAVGAADGIPGQKTLAALADFSHNNGTGSANLTPETFTKIRKAHTSLLSAENFLTNSQSLHESHQYQAALEELNKAKQASRYLTLPAGYEEALLQNTDSKSLLAADVQQPDAATTADDEALVAMQTLLQQLSTLELLIAQQNKAMGVRLDLIRIHTEIALK